MEPLAAIKVENIGVTLEKVCDFIYYEGPLLSLFVNKESKNQYYFYKWADCDEYLNRWMIFPVSVSQLTKFLQQNINLRSIISNNPFVFCCDIDDELNHKECFIIPINSIPLDYIPSDESFFDEESYTVDAITFKRIITKYSESNILECLLSEVRKQSEDIKCISDMLHILMTESSTDVVKVLSANYGNNLLLVKTYTN